MDQVEELHALWVEATRLTNAARPVATANYDEWLAYYRLRVTELELWYQYEQARSAALTRRATNI